MIIDPHWVFENHKEAARLIESLQCERDALAEQVENWKEAAAQYARNEDFYRGIVRQIGELFGEEARTSDDGSVQDDVLALKVPELVDAIDRAMKAEGGREKNDGTET